MKAGRVRSLRGLRTTESELASMPKYAGAAPLVADIAPATACTEPLGGRLRVGVLIVRASAGQIVT
jgi:hypothetical protein